MSKSWLLYVKIIFVVIVWGASFVATKVALHNGFSLPDSEVVALAEGGARDPQPISPVTVVWLRFAMGVVILGGAVFARRQMALPGWKDLAYFTALGFIGITFHQWLQSTGLETSEATTTAWIVATSPVFIALLGAIVLRERLGWGQIAGIALATFGVSMVVSKGNLGSLFTGNFGTIGDRLIMISAPNWAIFSVFSRSGLKRHPAARMMFYVMGLGWLLSTIQLMAGPGFSEIPHITGEGWIGIAFLGVFCSGLAYIFWYDALEKLPASQAGVFLYLEPVIASFVAAFLLGEVFLGVTLLGGAIILAGVWLVNR
ncbi:MAG TPA: DMT family transporter [Anaerolineaceae bacterium]|nr:DMT family transporter [Anaerolineaceae bacterium]